MITVKKCLKRLRLAFRPALADQLLKPQSTNSILTPGQRSLSTGAVSFHRWTELVWPHAQAMHFSYSLMHLSYIHTTFCFFCFVEMQSVWSYFCQSARSCRLLTFRTLLLGLQQNDKYIALRAVVFTRCNKPGGRDCVASRMSLRFRCSHCQICLVVMEKVSIRNGNNFNNTVARKGVLSKPMHVCWLFFTSFFFIC